MAEIEDSSAEGDWRRHLIPGLESVTADSLTFLVLGAALVAVAWYGSRKWFLPALSVISLLLLASWLSAVELLVLALFLGPPYLAMRIAWGKEIYGASLLVAGTVGWQVLLFVYLRKYEWAGDFEFLQHPIAIVGLSYMLFRVIHLTVEAPYLGHLKFSAARYFAYTTSFWTLLSGPIQRYEAFTQGLGTTGLPSEDDVLAASHRLINGLIKAFVIAPVFLPASDIGALAAADANWLDFAIVLYAYPIYLYLNFSGYTDLVIALARLCGVDTMPENFNRPYAARNLLDFWGRWHISFGVWIRQYIFNPLSKSLLRKGPRWAENYLLAVCVIVTFVLVGAWHGTTGNFIVFGLLHGVGIVAISVYDRGLKTVLGRKRRKAFLEHPVTRSVSIVLCFHYVSATILLFPNGLASLQSNFEAFFRTQGLL